jgi:SAM-dependent methyltransferase
MTSGPTRTVRAGEHPEPVDGALAEFRRRQSKRQAQAYAQFFSPVTRQFIPGLVRALGRPDGTALDLGCGDGSLTVALTGGGWDVLALDLSPDLAALARAGTAAPVVVGDALRLPLAGGRLAAVATAFVLPHLSELDAALAEAYRVLRAGGRLVLAGWAPIATSPFTGLASGLLRDRAAADQRARLVEAERRTDAGYLCARAEAAGFADVQLERLSTLVQLPSARVWWTGLVGASCGFGELYRSQTSEVQQETREAFAAAARAFERADGEVVVPAAALVLSGRRP